MNKFLSIIVIVISFIIKPPTPAPPIQEYSYYAGFEYTTSFNVLVVGQTFDNFYDAEMYLQNLANSTNGQYNCLVVTCAPNPLVYNWSFNFRDTFHEYTPIGNYFYAYIEFK